MIKKVNKKDGKVVSVDAEENTDNKDFKKTLKDKWRHRARFLLFQEVRIALIGHSVYVDNRLLMRFAKWDKFSKFISRQSKTAPLRGRKPCSEIGLGCSSVSVANFC